MVLDFTILNMNLGLIMDDKERDERGFTCMTCDIKSPFGNDFRERF